MDSEASLRVSLSKVLGTNAADADAADDDADGAVSADPADPLEELQRALSERLPYHIRAWIWCKILLQFNV